VARESIHKVVAIEESLTNEETPTPNEKIATAEDNLTKVEPFSDEDMLAPCKSMHDEGPSGEDEGIATPSSSGLLLASSDVEVLSKEKEDGVVDILRLLFLAGPVIPSSLTLIAL